MADELVKTNNALTSARPDFIPTTREGTEHITQDDVQIPRLVIAQQMSPEIEDGNAKFIPDLRAGQMFNSLTKRIYGKEPLDFAVVRATKPRWVEFAPREEGGGVVDPNVPEGDPRTEFWTDEDGKRRSPRATKFYDFILVLDPYNVQELVALSLKSTGLTVARQLNGFIQMRQAAVYAGLYRLEPKQKRNPKGTFYQFDIRPNGWITVKETFEALKEMYDSLKTENVTIHAESLSDIPDENDDFEFGANTGNSEM